jgi:hypothetical protein
MGTQAEPWERWTREERKKEKKKEKGCQMKTFGICIISPASVNEERKGRNLGKTNVQVKFRQYLHNTIWHT